MPDAYVTIADGDSAAAGRARLMDATSTPGAHSPEVMYNMIERKDLELFESLGGTRGITSSLQVDTEQGLTSAQVLDMREKYGVNELPQTEKVTYLSLVKEGLGDLMMRMLIVAAVVSIIFGMTLKNPHTGEVDLTTGWIEGTAILISVTIVVNVTAINDYKKAKKFEAMSLEQSKKDVEVLRDGEKHCIDISEVVVGDVLFVAAGQSLPADAVYLKGQDLKADESAVTGETDVMKKRPESDPFFISGTNLLEGDGQVVVINVGESSFAGKLAISSRGAPSDTPLQVKLGWLAEMIGKLGLAAATLTFLILSIKDIVMIVRGDHPFSITSYVNFLLVGITLVVVAIPEGLPLAVTISLAYSMKEMMKDNCLVRVLAACETMGGTNAICSDKTGTLTMNAMTVVQGWLAGDHFVLGGYGVTGGADAAVTEPGARTVTFHGTPATVTLLCEALAHNSACEELLVDGKLVWVGGNKTEHGLLGFVTRVGQDYRALRAQVSSADKRSYPFSSTRKRSTSVVLREGQWRVFVKGASELVLEDCTHTLTRSGDVAKLDPDTRAGLIATIEQMAAQGNRTIAVAYCDLAAEATFPAEEPTLEFTLVSIVGIQDPIRTEVPDAIIACHKAGITVRMVTGDNRHTATAIARKCGLLEGPEQPGEVMEGREFRRLAAERPDHLKELIPQLRVLARSSPTDKLVLVAYLMDEGDIVAVTGDGTNDAPALKLADVGFAMRSGTDVATGAAEMVLMDDNFATVVRAAVWGRTVNENIRKFLQFQLTVNTAGVLLTLIGSALSAENEEPLKPVQLLWLNLIMDTLAALALATESPAPDTLTRPGSGPISRASPLISNRMWLFILVHASYQLALILIISYVGVHIFNIGPCGPEDYLGHDVDGRCVGGNVNQTAMFNTFIWMQLFNEFNARKLHGEKNPFEGMRRSKLFLVIFVVCVVFQFCATQLFGKFMSTVPLTTTQFFICIGFGASELVVGLLVSCIPVPAWKPKTADANKKGLDPVKKAIIKEAIANAGMLAVVGAERESTPLRGPRERWAFAIAGVMSNQRVIKAIVETADSRISNSVIRRRRDSSMLAFRNHHPAAKGTGIRIV